MKDTIQGPYHFNIAGHLGIWGKCLTEVDRRGKPINIRVAKVEKGYEELARIMVTAINREGA